MTDYATLAGRILAPERPRLTEARAAIAGMARARDAWNALEARGLVPPTGNGDEQRRFEGRNGSHTAIPPTVAACVEIGSDPTNVLAAERFAREVVARGSAWDERLRPALAARYGGRSMIWRRVRARRWRPSFSLYRAGAHQIGTPLNDFTRAYHDAVYVALSERIDDALSSRPSAWPLAASRAVEGATNRGVARFVDSHVMGDARWRQAALEGLRVPAKASPFRALDLPVTPALVGRAFSELPNPFEPLLELWATGYALDRVTRDAIVLIAPAAEE